MTQRQPFLVTSVALLALAFFASVLTSAAPAHALSANGHGPGYLSADGWWLGTYSLDDGSRGFCLNAGKPSPTGSAVDYVDGDALGWYTPEQGAALAYISRTWAGTADRVEAAAGQLATWMVAGLGDHSPESYAARAGSDAAAVLERANSMTEEARRLGSRSVAASAVVELADGLPGRVRAELTADRLDGSGLVTPHSHQGVVELTGAVFADGSATASVWNGEDVPITPTGDGSSVSVHAAVAFGELPYGGRMKVAVPHADAQALLVAVPATATAAAEAEGVGVSPLPFSPVVSTVTSRPDAVPGDSVSDHLLVEVGQAEGLLPSWGVWESENGFVPVSATIASTLYGPFDQPVVEQADVPEGAPTVCTVELVVTGPGEYDTDECVLPAAGWYVWAETIEPDRTDSTEGGARLHRWTGRFGVASEITRVTAPATPPVPEVPRPASPAMTSTLAATGSDHGPAVPLALWATGSLLAGGLLVARGARRGRHHAAGRVGL